MSDGTRGESSAAGRLLVSSPSTSDLNFDRTVVLVLEHGDEGALGVVLNRPTAFAVVDTLPRWAALVTAPTVFFSGGPVSPGSVLALARSTSGSGGAGFTPVIGDLGVVDVSVDPDALAVAVLGLRLFAGYSGWGAGQLDGEIEGGGWFVVDPHPGDPLTLRPQDLWTEVLNREEGRSAMWGQDPRRRWTN